MHRYRKRPSSEAPQTAVDALVLRYRVYVSRIRKMLYLGGVLQDHTRPLVQTYATGILVIIVCFSHFFFLINFCRYHTNNLLLLLKCLGLASSFITPTLMSCCFLVKRKKLLKLHKTLDDLFERILARDECTKANVLTFLYAFDRPCYMLFLSIGLTSAAILLPSVLSIIRLFIFHSNETFKWSYPIKYPWPVPDNGFLLYLQFLYHASVFWWLLFTISGVDSLFGFYSFQISSILRALAARLTNPQPNEVFLKVLKMCIETHRQLLWCTHILQDIYEIIILRMLLTNAVLMCSLIFEASPFTDKTINQIFIFVSYMTLKLLQTFIYAWYGNLITSASEHFRDGVYFSEWPDSDLGHHIRTNIIMTMMQKPMIITALKMSSVNVNMFTNVLNTTISYFFLLQSLDAK